MKRATVRDRQAAKPCRFIPDSPLSSITITPVKSNFLMRLVFGSVALVVVFAAVFTVGEMYDVWREAPSPFFRNADFIAGFLFIGAVLVAAFRASRRRVP